MLEVAAVVAMEGSPPASGVPRPRDQRDCQAEVIISRRAPPSLLVSHNGCGLPLPLDPALLLLRFRFQAVAYGRLSISILPIWSTGGEPGCVWRRWRPASAPYKPRQSSAEAMTSTGVLTSPEWMFLFAFRPLGPLPMIHYIITVCGGSQVYCQQFQFNRVVAIIVRLPTGGAATALYSSRIRCPEPELSGHLQHTVLVARRWRRRRQGHGKSDEVSGCVLCLIFDATSSWRGGRKAGEPVAAFCLGMRGSGDAGAGEQETSHPQRRFK
ncbi:hypothetical protein TRIUR3_04370 [Triticum urartu]|uniref:Uncharacterized protein n=1 Tax=Triticum urartu TaxID=4572 RepID=M8A4A7_TRIUA|nr:hypothetical protein TRIUR3_04370 [Triticum urartu]